MKPDNYFEGILQLRDVDQVVLDFVEDACEKEGKRMVSKVMKVKNGFDFYMQSNRFLKKLGRILEDKFSGETKLTATLHTRKDNKDLYRLTFLFRQVDMHKGDTLLFDGDEYLVTGVGKKVLLRNNKTQKKERFTFEELREKKARKV